MGEQTAISMIQLTQENHLILSTRWQLEWEKENNSGDDFNKYLAKYLK